MKLLIVLATVMTVLLSCGQSGRETDKQYCLLTDYIYISQDDDFTLRTAEDILVHNETRQSICE